MTDTLRVLHVDDEPDLLEIGKIFLEECGDFIVTTALSAPDAIRMLEQEKFDAIISDFKMPVMDGIGFVKKLRSKKDTIPFILFTGRGHEEIAIEALNAGADFYLPKAGYTKAQFTELSSIIRHVVRRHRAEEALRRSEERYRTVADYTYDWEYWKAPDGSFLYVSPSCERITGYKSEEFLFNPSLFLTIIHPDDRTRVSAHITEPDTKDADADMEYRIITKRGELRWISHQCQPVYSREGTYIGRRAGNRDITVQKHAEDAVRESEERYRRICEGLTDYLYTVRVQDGRAVSTMHGAACVAVTGYTAEEFAADPYLWLRMVFEEDRNRIIHHFEKVLSGKPVPPVEHRIVRKDGQVCWVRDTPILQFDTAGMLVSYDGVIKDITATKKAEEELRKSEERYRNVVEDQTELICRFLPDGTYIFVNNAYCRFFALKREDILGHRFSPQLYPEDREIVARHFASLTPQQPVMNIDQRIIMPDGSTRWQKWSDRGIFDKNGCVTEYQSVGRDITEQRELEEEMKCHEQELMRFSTSLAMANKKLNLLYSITRHDISNQLAVLQGYRAMLEKKQPDLRFSEYFQKINEAAQRISAMILFTREYENIGVKDPVWQNIQKLVDTAAKEAPLGQVMVKNVLPSGAEVFADPLVIKVWYNLMDNAVRYGGKITTIRFSVEESEDNYLIVCEDDGVGVPADEKEKIFLRGFGKNTGLGLALSQEILAITGITIKETGEPGSGARFEMNVPKGMWRTGGESE